MGNVDIFSAVQEVRQRLFRKVRESIEARLFLAKPPFCAALRQLAALVADMSRIRCLAASPGHLYILEEYADQQVALREQTTKPGLEGVVEKMQQVRMTCCHPGPSGGCMIGCIRTIKAPGKCTCCNLFNRAH